MSRIKFMNTEIDNLTMQETLKVIEELIQKKKCICCNTKCGSYCSA